MAEVDVDAGAPAVADTSAKSRPPGKRARKAAAQAESAKRQKVRAPSLVVFGLGSVGEERINERHNVGHRVLAALAQKLNATLIDTCQGAEGTRTVPDKDRPWLLLPPQGSINDSGPSLRKALQSLGQASATTLSVVDDVALPLGTIRLRAKGSSGGHNGLRSIEAEFGADYHRLKVGIGGDRSAEHVVGEFSADEAELVEAVVTRASEAAAVWLEHGPEEVEKILAIVNAPKFCIVEAKTKPDSQAGPQPDSAV
eukprot:TRINITY_DN39695_c0_g1_i1.p1 TRINITY_DN39695_c0_g1~~TRINITY_DN39695_c0_g1_i1.p1  ORF type:complete len:255 (-),score=40.46 TRINITY_DN39695_c0_g1_i1:140-904(-)